MIQVTKPVPCTKCNRPIENYKIDVTKGTLDFRCPCGNIDTYTEAGYRGFLTRSALNAVEKQA